MQSQPVQLWTNPLSYIPCLAFQIKRLLSVFWSQCLIITILATVAEPNKTAWMHIVPCFVLKKRTLLLIFALELFWQEP